MTGFHRLPILVVAALLVAGCGATPNSSVPSTLASSSPAASSPATASPPAAPATGSHATSSAPPYNPTLAPLATPAPGCIALDDGDLRGLEVDLSSVYPSGNGGFGGFSVGHVNGALQVTRIEELSGQRRSAVPPPRRFSNDRGLLLGGREFVTFPSTWFDGHSNPQAMIDARVILTLDGASPIDLPTRFVAGNENFDQVAVTVPDVSGPGSVELAFAWADACFRYEAEGTIPVDVVPLARTVGCELDEELYWDQLHALLDGAIAVAGTTPSVGSAFNESKFAPYVNPGIDAFIGYMFDADAAEVTVAPGGTVSIENRKPRLHLADKLTVVIWTRRSLADAVKDYPPDGTIEVFEGRLERQADGSYALPVPDEPGRYVAALSVKFDSPCTTGTLWSVANIAVAR